MKKVNFARTTWILAIFIGLIIILIAVIDYKVHYKYKINNKIYFYDCDGILCVTEVKNDNHLLYSKYECGYNECPIFRTEINDEYVILNKKNTSILYNYRTGKIISSNYDAYEFLNNNYIIVTKGDYKGIINLKEEVMVAVSYQELGINKETYLTGYNLISIIAKKNDKYGIISIKDGSIIEPFEYTEENLDDLLLIIN